MRRYGLRLGISANPVVLLAASVVMLVVLGVSGGASVALLVAASAARILDIALTDGTTRTSINAMYQVLPERLRLPAQATIEGTGVPVAISASGLLVLGLNALPSPLTTIVVTTVVVCAVWVWTGVLLHRAYGPALVDTLRERRLLDGAVALGGTTADLRTAERLLESPDPRSARLGLELVERAGGTRNARASWCSSSTTPNRGAALRAPGPGRIGHVGVPRRPCPRGAGRRPPRTTRT